MSTYTEKVNNLFWNSYMDLEQDFELPEFLPVETLVELMDFEESELVSRLKDDDRVNTFLGITDQTVCTNQVQINEDDDDDWSIASEDEIPVRVNTSKEEASTSGIKNEEGTDYIRKRKSPELPSYLYDKSLFKVKKKTITDTSVLNLDCVNLSDRRELIEKWVKSIELIIHNNSSFDTAEKVLALMEHKSEGIAATTIKTTKWQPDFTPAQAVNQVMLVFFALFLGIDLYTNREQEKQKEIEIARKNIVNLTICDICYLEPFTCEYEKNFYKLPQDEYPTYINMYMDKLPLIGEQTKKVFQATVTDSMKFSLGYAIRVAKEQIGKICEMNTLGKKLKKFNKKCCAISEQPNLTFGCSTKDKTRKYKKKYKKYKKKYSWKKTSKRFKPGRYFRKRTPKEDKSKFCPKGKKNYKCWICKQDGHYANECPNRAEFPNKAKMLQERGIWRHNTS